MVRLSARWRPLPALLVLLAASLADVVAVRAQSETPELALRPDSAPRPEAVHCVHGCPVGASPRNDLIVRPIYALSSNDDTKFADWAAYRVTRRTVGSGPERDWRADPLLDADDTLEPSDYRGAHARFGFDRGHQVPLASVGKTRHARYTNLLSNITPQKSALNQGAWRKLEAAEQRLARRAGIDAVYVVTGPLYERTMPVLPGADEPHRVPSGYWKVLAVSAPVLRVAAFVFDQETPRAEEICTHVVRVDEVERRSGLDLFAELDDGAERGLEAGPAHLARELGCAPTRTAASKR